MEFCNKIREKYLELKKRKSDFFKTIDMDKISEFEESNLRTIASEANHIKKKDTIF